MKSIFNTIILAVCFTQYLIGADSLRLTHPNGGQRLQARTNITITWDGLPDTTIVKLKFSSDAGLSWNEITDEASNLSYDWEIPELESNSCLISIEQDNVYEVGLVWQKSFGGRVSEEARSIEQTRDGFYIIAGYSKSVDGDIINSKGLGWDYWILKLTDDGELVWQKSFGGNGTDVADFILQSQDGSYIIAGNSSSIDGDITSPKGSSDYWILKLKEDGVLEWEKSFGGSKGDIVSSIVQTQDGGYIIAGYSISIDGDITNPHGMSDYWIIKLKEDGVLDWQKSFGGSDADVTTSIIQTKDRGYIISGYSRSVDGDITNPKGDKDYWILKLKEDGVLDWQKSFGGSNEDVAKSIIQTQDNGYVIAGYSMSTDGDITSPKGSMDYWILKLKEDGELEWEKSFGGSLGEKLTSLVQTFDGGFIITGASQSIDGDITNPKGGFDYWILKIKEDGVLDWEKSFGGSNSDVATSLVQTYDGNYIVVGNSGSRNGDITNPKGGWDYWILKLAGSVVSKSDTSNSVFSIFIPVEQKDDYKFEYFLTINDLNNSALATVILKESTYINLELYNILGKRISSLYSGKADKGRNEYRIDYDDFQLSRNFITGRYYVKLTTPTKTKTEILEIVK